MLQAIARGAERLVDIRCGMRMIGGILAVPRQPRGVIAFAHGSGSGRFSPRNQLVAGALQEAGFATLLLDLLEGEEADERAKVFDVELLAERLLAAARWLRQHPETRRLPLGYFGASTGTAAALAAAAWEPDVVAAIVSRGGRPDLASAYLPSIKAATLFIVGGNDDVVVDLNQQALRELTCPKQMIVIPDASHLFPEPGALEEAARLAQDWFQRYLPVEESTARIQNGLGARFAGNHRDARR